MSKRHDVFDAIWKMGIISSFDGETSEVDREANVSWTSLAR